jgi:CheY-like chemotaxis protein
VLLVEDEDAVRDVARAVLRGQGYAVLDAAGGEEALRLADGHPGPIHLLVTDVVMPRMGGRVLAQRLTERRPGVRVLYVSGYTEDEVVRRGIAGNDLPFLQKPFTPVSLALQVRAVLDQPPPGCSAAVPPVKEVNVTR